MPQPTAEPPTVAHLCPAFANIPAELTQLRQWACFYTKPRRNGKLGKPPIDPNSGNLASNIDPATWGTFLQACQYYEAHRNDRRNPIRGIGFMFSENDPYCGIDLDGVLKYGKPTADAARIIDELDSYTEESFSGTGIHGIVKGTLSGPGRNRNGIEIYDRDRFFVFTGRVLDGRSTIHPRQAQVDHLYSRAAAVIAGEKSSSRPDSISPVQAEDSSNPVSTESKPCSVATADVESIIKLLLKDKKGEPLFRGANSSHESHRDADMALCGILAFYCRKNAGLMDAIFRQSALFRPKWDSARGSVTYGEQTIRRAIAGQRETWHPQDVPRHYSFPSELLDVSRIRGPVDALMLQFVYRKTILFCKVDNRIPDFQIANALSMKRIPVGIRRRALQAEGLLRVTHAKHVEGKTHQWRSGAAVGEGRAGGAADWARETVNVPHPGECSAAHAAPFC